MKNLSRLMQDALNDKIVHEVLVPTMFRLWFLNRERSGWMGCREAYHLGVPIRNIPYGNCQQCLKAGGLMQRCRACGLDHAFQSMILFSSVDIPLTVVDARFLHRMVGYPDQEHDPQIGGLVPGEHMSSVRPDVTWPIDRHGNRLFDQ